MSAGACTHAGWTTRAHARVREVTTVQLPPRHLRAGRLPVVAIGEELEVAPVLYLTELADVGCRAPTAWEAGPFGIVGACGVVGEPRVLRPGDDEGGPYGVDVLRVGEREVVVNPAGLEDIEQLEPGRPVFVEGSLYCDLDLVGLGSAVSVPMRGRYRLAAVRRYRACLPGPPRTEPLDRVPAPEDVDPDVFLHVADLVGPPRVQP
ncbi:hypothetical protein [Actinomycetospora sp. TBRC 11914]|uniref:hypothetical protein n=1 Tax=Actinomycetospora sp. TBRC 11914 TaxID=2729387 RepID=UPI00145E3EDF|nr:hypothetical protein [Actinomycetospora sp. TBRC 11914]NMO91907.1 hypothetical protein [Actinomycetospora sp. TBRC 11914]